MGGFNWPWCAAHRQRLPGSANLAGSTTTPRQYAFLHRRYNYLNVDDAWSAKKRVGGRLVAHKRRFPSGMKALGDYIHGKGLKYGIYGDAGTSTCAHYPGGCLPVPCGQSAASCVWRRWRRSCGVRSSSQPASQPAPPPSPGCRLPRVRGLGCPDLGRLGRGLPKIRQL